MDGSKTVALRYMTRFQCIGAECEDPCCNDWTVTVDEAHYERLRVAMAGTPEEQAEFTRALVREAMPPEERPRGHHALMVLKDDRSCAMLDGERLCTIQRRYGEALLPDTCAVYPRSVGRVGARLELAGAISCPEVARLCLLAEDATDLVPADLALFPRGVVHKSLTDAPTHPAERRFDDLRSLAARLLALRTYPTASRLFFTAFLIHRAGPLLEQGDEAGFAAEAGRLLRPEAFEALHRQFSAVAVQDPFAATVVSQIATARLAAAPPAFRRLAVVALGSDGADPIRLMALHESRRLLASSLAPRMDLHLENFCRNYWMKEWYLQAGGLVPYLHGLLVRVALFRFLALGHASLAAARRASPEEQQRALDGAAVEAAYALTRMIEHDETLPREILRALERQRMQTLAHAVSLIKF
ncbi:MAG: hypothetical protein EXR72_22710 [Myxococcales bacterium]|nr:hypothetical protein [Myxococcales bacterium]